MSTATLPLPRAARRRTPKEVAAMTIAPAVTPQPGDFGVVATHANWPGRTWRLWRYAQWLLYATVARAIEFGTDSPVDHAVVYIGNGQIVEAVRRVRIGTVDEYPGVIWSTGRLPAALTPTDEQRAAIVNAALAMVGDRYNVLDIIAIGLAQKRLGHLVDDHTWWARRLSADGREICSQLVDLAYERAGIHLFTDGRLSGLVDPGDLYRLLLPVPAVTG